MTKTKIIYAFLAVNVLVSCKKSNSQFEEYNTILKHPKVFYVETVNFGTDLHNCFGGKLFNHWSGSDFELKSTETTFDGTDVFQKHEFYDISKFSAVNKPVRFEKITLTLKGDWSVKNTSYSIERFRYESNGTWFRIGNLGDFKTHDRADDTLSPNQLDVDELCDQIVNKTILGSYK